MLSVTGWRMAGGNYRNGGVRMPGFVLLSLSNGTTMYFAENTPLERAFDEATRLRGADTSEARAKLAHWVKTGEGVRFELV